MGLLFLLAAASMAMEDAHLHRLYARSMLQLRLARQTHLPPPTLSPKKLLSPPLLPNSEDIPQLLEHIEESALASGLTWPQADYKVTPIDDTSLATLEIRCALKGPYPSLRRFITTLLATEPALAVRQFNLSRPNSDTPEVEAKMALVVFLSDGWSAIPRGHGPIAGVPLPSANSKSSGMTAAAPAQKLAVEYAPRVQR